MLICNLEVFILKRDHILIRADSRCRAKHDQPSIKTCLFLVCGLKHRELCCSGSQQCIVLGREREMPLCWQLSVVLNLTSPHSGKKKNLRIHPGFKRNLKVYREVERKPELNPVHHFNIPPESQRLPLHRPNNQWSTRSKPMPVKEVSESGLLFLNFPG